MIFCCGSLEFEDLTVSSAKLAQIEKELLHSYTYIIEKTTFCLPSAYYFDLECCNRIAELNHGRKVTRQNKIRALRQRSSIKNYVALA